MKRVSVPVAPPSRTTASRLTGSNYSSNLPPSWLSIASPNSLDNSLQVYHQTCTITASKCITTLGRSQPPSVSTNSLNYGLQVRTITASKCISKLAQLRPPRASLNSLGYGLQVSTTMASKLARWQSRSASLSSIDHGVVNRWTKKADSPSS